MSDDARQQALRRRFQEIEEAAFARRLSSAEEEDFIAEVEAIVSELRTLKGHDRDPLP